MRTSKTLRPLLAALVLVACSTPTTTTGPSFALPDTQFHVGDVTSGGGVDAKPVDATAKPDAPDDDALPNDDVDDDASPAAMQYFVSDDAASDKTAAEAVSGVAGTQGAALQIVYPPDHAMAPRDFAPITAQWTYSGPAVQFFVVRFANSLAEIDVVGDASAWKDGPGFSVTLPLDAWQQLFAYLLDPQWTVTVLAGKAQSGAIVGALQASASRTFHVSGDKAGGAIYYWNTGLSAVRVLEAGSLQPTTLPAGNGSKACVGCHSISPDGSAVALNSMGTGGGPGGGGFTMSLVSGKSAGTLSWVSPNATKALASTNTISAAFSAAYYTDANKWLVVPRAGKLTAVDLINGTTKPLVQGGDLGQQAFPSWSPDGATVVYASAANANGMSIASATKLYSVPFNSGSGGQASVIAGTETANFFHYYPAISDDGQFIVYNRAPTNGSKCPATSGGGGGGGPGGSSGASTYDNCHAELWIVPIGGGTPIRLDKANQDTTPLTNSWPTFGNVKGQKYWMAFSSRRNYGFKHTGSPAAPQVYVAAVDPDLAAQGVDPSYAALWLPGQDINAGCHIARWSAKPRD